MAKSYKTELAIPLWYSPSRWLSLSSFLSSESRSNACIDYAESQKKYSRARIELLLQITE